MSQKQDILVTKVSAVLAMLALTATILLTTMLYLLAELGAFNQPISAENWLLKALVIFAVVFFALGKIFSVIAVEIFDEAVTEHKIRDYFSHKHITMPAQKKES